MTTKGIEPQSQWLFTEEEVRNSPSVHDGLPVAEEISRRAKGVNFITQAGILLKIPQLTLGTASVFFHRFYMRYSMVPEKGGIHHYVCSSFPQSKSSLSLNKSLITLSRDQNIAATALFLATKAEENCRKTKEIVIAVVKVAQKNASLIIDEQSKEFWRWKDSILLYEETMLELLTFDVVLESPYTCLYTCLKALQIETHKPMRNVAWAFINDSCMTILCLLMPPRDIAVASIYFSAKFNNERLPDDQDGAPWWTRLNGVPERINQAIDVMADFYTENPLQKRENPYERSPGSSTEDLDRTRLRAESHSPVYGPPADRADAEEENHADTAINGNAEEDSIMKEDVDEGEIDPEAGDDDSKLKAMANDPGTHEPQHENGLTNGFAAGDGKRKENAEAAEEPEAKRIKIKNEQDESEEGEVEE
jgi:protein BUR2